MERKDNAKALADLANKARLKATANPTPNNLYAVIAAQSAQIDLLERKVEWLIQINHPDNQPWFERGQRERT